MFAVAVGLAAAMSGPANANTVTLDFNSQPTGTLTTFTQSGYTITPQPGDPGDQVTIQNVGGTNVLVDGQPYDVYGSSMTITRTAGGTFNLVSFDLANLDNPGYGVASVGTGGGFRVELDGTPGGADAYVAGSSTFTTVAPGDLTNLTSLYVNFVSNVYEGLNLAIDNIVLSANASNVPEPLSMALLGTGVVGLGLARRRRSKIAG
jgi:PEP-CTERM motif